MPMPDVWIEYKTRAVTCADHRPELLPEAKAGARAIQGSGRTSWIRIPESDDHVCGECLADMTEWEW